MVLRHQVRCARSLDHTMTFDRVRKAFDKLSDAEHECFAVHAQARCLFAVYSAIKDAGDEARRSELAVLLRAFRHADRVKGVLCRSVANPNPRIYDTETAVMTIWANTLRPWW